MNAVFCLLMILPGPQSNGYATLDTFTIEGCLEGSGSNQQEVMLQHTLVQRRQIQVPVQLLATGSVIIPEAMRSLGRPGIWHVVVEVLIDTRGIVRMASIISSEHCWLEAESIRVAYGMRFAPPVEDGKPVWALARIPYSFRLLD